MRKSRLLLPLLLLSALPAEAQSVSAPSVLEPASTGGLAAVDRALARLSTHRRLLVIGAHPDDEDTSVLTLVAREMGGEAAYLSLSRGEGGQNLIGPELGVGLGLIRSRELLAARQVDGGRQFFSRAYDFGFTRSLDETLRFWPREIVLEDTVRILRRFQPQVVISVFPPSAQAGHGQHQVAGLAAHEGFQLAGDPAAYPELRQEGLDPWQPAALYRSTFFDETATTLRMPLGGVDPLAGRSILQLAAASRSMHRSQDMGRFQELGGQEGKWAWVAGTAGGAVAKDLFAGVDTRLAAVASPLPDATEREAVAAALAAAGDLAASTRAALHPRGLEEAVPAFAAILKHLRTARERLEGTSPERRTVARLIEEKIAVAESGLLAAAGIAFDASTAQESVTPGTSLPVQAVLWNSGSRKVEGVRVSLEAVSGGAPQALDPGGIAKWDLAVRVPAEAPPTVPYFLRRPLQGALYDWSEAAPQERGEPFGPPPFSARFELTVDGVKLAVEREVVHRHRDQALGEIRRPLAVVPVLEVAVAQPLLVWPLSRKEPYPMAVTLTSHAAAPLDGRLELKVPAGWPVSAPTFSLAPGESKTLEVAVAAPSGLAAGVYPLEFTAVAGGQRSSLAVPVVDYPHIRATPFPRPASLQLSAVDLRLPPLKKVGYVRGASDRVPEFLLEAGVPLDLLTPGELENADLKAFDAIVVGSRAYETEPALARANPRLLDYVREGGLLLVQYQQYPFIEGKFSPLALDIARPHDRVTDETAPMQILDPAHPAFNSPNKIGEDDWKGWVQERGLYFAHTWDPAFTPLLATADPGGPEQRGGLLVAKLGKGTYVYTGLAFFRQLPAGVPGAYRLFANLLGLGR